MNARLDDRLGLWAVTYLLFVVTLGPGLALFLVLVFAIWIGWRWLCRKARGRLGCVVAGSRRTAPPHPRAFVHPPLRGRVSPKLSVSGEDLCCVTLRSTLANASAKASQRWAASRSASAPRTAHHALRSASRLSDATIASGSSASSNNPRKCLSVSRSPLVRQGSKTRWFAVVVEPWRFSVLGVGYVVNGLIALALSLAIWHISPLKSPRSTRLILVH